MTNHKICLKYWKISLENKTITIDNLCKRQSKKRRIVFFNGTVKDKPYGGVL